MKNPYYQSQTPAKAETIKGNFHVSSEMSKNIEIAMLAKEVVTLRAELFEMRQQVNVKADKAEITSILAWDLSDPVGKNSAAVAVLVRAILDIMADMITRQISAASRFVEALLAIILREVFVLRFLGVAADVIRGQISSARNFVDALLEIILREVFKKIRENRP